MFDAKYTDVVEALRFDIRNGRFGGRNARLPSFRELSKEYKVSLVTIAKSMNRKRSSALSLKDCRRSAHSRRSVNSITPSSSLLKMKTESPSRALTVLPRWSRGPWAFITPWLNTATVLM